jgi:hypothetical protein
MSPRLLECVDFLEKNGAENEGRTMSDFLLLV